MSCLAESIDRSTNRRIRIVPFVGDVTDEAFRKHVFDEIGSNGDIVQICVPAAGITRDSLAAKLDRITGKATLYPSSRRSRR